MGSVSAHLPRTTSPKAIERERNGLLRQLEHSLEIPLLVLGFAWLVLLVVEFTSGLTPLLETIGTTIWIIFIADFSVKFAVAPSKSRFLRKQWMTALSLLLPALRVLRIVRVARLLRLTRTTRGIRLFRLISSMNRGLHALRASMGRRGFGYVLTLTVLVTFAGAAGMYTFERGEAPGFSSYGAAVWWTAMMITTVGSDYFPQSPEGRILCLLLATFAFTIWGYVTATLATFFIGRDAAEEKSRRAAAKSNEELRQEIRALRQLIESRLVSRTDRESI